MTEMSARAPECHVSRGDHLWREGGERDHGRYHCAQCYTHLDPMRAVREAREMRAERDAFAEAFRLALGLPATPTVDACRDYVTLRTKEAEADAASK